MLVLLFGAGFFSYYYFKSITLIEKEVRINTIPVIKGHQNVMLNVDEVSFIYLVENMTWVVTKNNTEYHSTKKLKELELDLEGLDFFRVNRQLLASKHSIKSYGKAEHRKLAIHLNDKNESTYLLSKEKVTKFKNWLA